MHCCYRCAARIDTDICPECGYNVSEYIETPGTLSPDFRIGVNGRYSLCRVLGYGNFGITYLGYDNENARKVAIKEYFPMEIALRSADRATIVASSTETVNLFKSGVVKFFEESEILSRYSYHRNIVKVYDYFYENETAYTIMEYVDGVNLSSIIKNNCVLDDKTAIDLLLIVVDALIEVHRDGILHRDICPSNILINENGDVKLIDFSMARTHLYDPSHNLSVILKGGYAPIELYTKHGNQGPWTDVYELCATLYFCVTGRAPKQTTDKIHDRIEPPSRYNPQISPTLEAIIMRGIAFSCSERIPSMTLLKLELEACVHNKQPYLEQTPAHTDTSPSVKETPIEAKTTPKRKKKHILLPILSFAALLVIVVVAVFLLRGVSLPKITSNFFQSQDHNNTLRIIMNNNDSNSNQVWKEDLSRQGTVVISDKVTSIENWEFYEFTWITSVTIPDSVTSIGDGAFNGCSGLTSITIPDSVTSIGARAFEGCTGLTEINVDDKNTSYADIDGVLLNKDKTELIQYPAGKTDIKYYLPTSVTNIGRYAFSGCSRLINIVFHNMVKSIEEEAFCKCTGLTVLILPNGVRSIGDRAFYNSGLTNITIPNNVTSIGDGAFRYCSELTNINVDDGNMSYMDINGVLFNKDKTELIQYPAGKIDIKYDIPNRVASIEDLAFLGCTELTSVTIPDSVTHIGDRAFYGCTGLISITIPDSVTSIGDRAFYNSGLTSITIPNSVTSIGEWVFESCTELKSIVLLNGVTSIGERAFYDCTELTNITIPDGVTNIGDRAFFGCTGLTSITIPDSVTSIGDRAFYGCTGLTSITIPDSVKSIGSNTFGGCTGLTNITIPNSVTSIEEWAFYGCTGLTSITIPDSVTSIGDGAFGSCTKLTSVTIPNNMTSIGEKVFYECTGLRSITIPDSVTSIGAEAFRYCTGLTSITIPGSVTYIGEKVFYECTGLRSITIPDKITSIEARTFGGCTGLASITIPNSVTSIEVQAFDGCTGLTSITIPNSVTNIDRFAFNDCIGLTEISVDDNNMSYTDINGVLFNKSETELLKYPAKKTDIEYTIPDSVTSLCHHAFDGCTGLSSIKIHDGVTSIGTEAFKNWTDEQTIYIEGSDYGWRYDWHFLCSAQIKCN